METLESFAESEAACTHVAISNALLQGVSKQVNTSLRFYNYVLFRASLGVFELSELSVVVDLCMIYEK